MNIDILKCHGSGNDFILIDELRNKYSFSEEMRKNIAITLCDRKGPLGADGILFVLKGDNAHGRMRIFNSDGTEPQMCGNGLRCVGRYVMDVLQVDTVHIETMKAKYVVKRAPQIYPEVATVEIEIDTVSFEVSSLPVVHNESQLLFQVMPKLSDSLKFSAVSITNPHIVSIVSNIDDRVIEEIGKTANNSPDLFPQGVNVNFVKIMDERSIYVKTYERGVGITKSCGTGMTASSIITCLYDDKRLNSDINIYNDGGMIRCRVVKDNDNKYKVIFIGNATYVYKALIDLDMFLQHKEAAVEKNYITLENTAYDNFLNHVTKILSQ